MHEYMYGNFHKSTNFILKQVRCYHKGMKNYKLKIDEKRQIYHNKRKIKGFSYFVFSGKISPKSL